MATVHELRVDSIVVGKRLRPTSDAAIAELVESLRRTGEMLQPIVINRPNVVPRLVCGAHRLAAAKILGWEVIPCSVLPVGTTEDDCLQIEIAENLHRSELTKDERDRHIRLLAELIEKRDNAKIHVSQDAAPEIGAVKTAQSASFSDGGTGGPGRGNKGVVGKIAEQTGLSKDTVRRALNPEAEAAKKAARQRREAEQAEHDRQREEFRATLPDSIQRAEAAKDANRQRGRTSNSDESGLATEDRIAELEEAVRAVEADNAALKGENKLYGEMRAQFEKGGFSLVIAGKDEEIRVLKTRVERESHDKAEWKRQADYWKGQAIKAGWKPDRQKIDMQTGEVRDA